eukprot:1134319-Pyramimonas_sp.AAC.1
MSDDPNDKPTFETPTFDEPPDPCSARRRKAILKSRKDGSNGKPAAGKLQTPQKPAATSKKVTKQTPASSDEALINPKLARTKELWGNN